MKIIQEIKTNWKKREQSSSSQTELLDLSLGSSSTTIIKDLKRKQME